MANNFVVLLICLVSIAKLQSISCNENFFLSRQKHFYYIESEQKFTWYDAIAKCASMNMSLATIDTKIKSEDATNLLSDIFGKRIPLWIGGCVSGVNPRQFVWISTGKKFIYTNWAYGQPDFAGNNEYCAQIGWTDTMEWNDHVCSNQFGFMCELSKLHDCEEKLEMKLQEEMKKQQQVELKELVGEILRNHKDADIENRKFRDIIFNINQNPK